MHFTILYVMEDEKIENLKKQIRELEKFGLNKKEILNRLKD